MEIFVFGKLLSIWSNIYKWWNRWFTTLGCQRYDSTKWEVEGYADDWLVISDYGTSVYIVLCYSIITKKCLRISVSDHTLALGGWIDILNTEFNFFRLDFFFKFFNYIKIRRWSFNICHCLWDKYLLIQKKE